MKGRLGSEEVMAVMSADDGVNAFGPGAFTSDCPLALLVIPRRAPTTKKKRDFLIIINKDGNTYFTGFPTL
jgi:hypothetical protein